MSTSLKVKRMLADTKAKMTDEDLFGSPFYCEYLQNIADTISGKYGRGAIVNSVYQPTNEKVGYTDNFSIFINMANDLTTSCETQALMNLSGIGILGHEVGHILFTDFAILDKFLEALKKGTLYPKIPSEKSFRKLVYRQNLQELLDAIDESKPYVMKLIFKIAAHFSNIVEDGYVEGMMKKKYPGTVAMGIQLLNKIQSEQVPTVQEMIDNGKEPLSIMSNLLLQYAKTLNYNNPEGLTNEYVEVLTDCENLIKATVVEDDPKKRMTAVNHLLVYCWSFIKEMIEKMENNKNNKNETDDSKTTDTNSDDSSDADDDSSGMGNSPDESSDTGDFPSTNSNPSDDSSGNAASSEADSDSSNNAKKDVPAQPISADDLIKKFEDEIIRSSQNAQNMSSHSVLRKTNASQTVNDGENSPLPKMSAEKLLEKAMEQVALGEVGKQVEESIEKQLQDQVNRIVWNDINQSVKISVHRQPVPKGAKKNYDTLMKELAPISKMLQKSILRVIKQRHKGSIERGLMMGSRLDHTAYYRNDGRIFTKRNRPNDEINLAVAVLVDLSGSMGGQKLNIARKTALLIYDFCQGLDIPITVYGHDALYSVNLYSFVEYDSIDGRDKYRILAMEAGCANRDGCAVRFVAEHLCQRSEEAKLFIIISDGLPSYYNSDRDAEMDLVGVRKEYSGKGITFIAAAIDQDKPQIKKYYGEKAFLDITDLTKLPITMAKLIAKYAIT